MSTRENDTTRGATSHDDESITDRVVRTVAAYSNETPLELPPLFEAIDPDALEALFPPQHGDDSPSVATVEFHYAGYDVTVFPDQTISVGGSATSTE